MSEARIDILETGIRVTELDVPNKDVAEFLRGVPEPERELNLIRAIEVGVFCLERARAGQDLDFVRRQVELLLNGVQSAVEKIPEEAHKSLAAKIGTGEGQVLAPVQSLVEEVSRAAAEKIKEVKDLLSQDIDPTKETTTLGKALRSLRDLLDPQRKDSIQGSFDAAIKEIAAEGGPLANAVKQVVTDSVKPLKDQVESLAMEVRGREAAAEALEQTTQKGVSYEDQVVVLLRDWAKPLGAEVHHVGPDNQPGDVVIKISQLSATGIPLRIVVEVRDRQTPTGRMAISNDVAGAMSERGANAGVYLSRTQDGLGKEIGEWAEGTCEYGRFVACTHGHLITALRFLIALEHVANLRAATPTVDVASIEAQIKRIRTALGRIKTINARVTDVKGGADAIQAEAEALRDEIRGALTEMDDAIRATAATQSPAGGEGGSHLTP